MKDQSFDFDFQLSRVSLVLSLQKLLGSVKPQLSGSPVPSIVGKMMSAQAQT